MLVRRSKIPVIPLGTEVEHPEYGRCVMDAIINYTCGGKVGVAIAEDYTRVWAKLATYTVAKNEEVFGRTKHILRR